MSSGYNIGTVFISDQMSLETRQPVLTNWISLLYPFTKYKVQIYCMDSDENLRQKKVFILGVKAVS